METRSLRAKRSKYPQRRLDDAVSIVHRGLVRHKFVALPLSLAVYMSVFLFWGSELRVSTNYIVILPVIVSAISFGLPGGILAGVFGLPLNMLMFALIRHPECSPESPAIAEISGILLGSALGYLSDYYLRLQDEILHRSSMEAALGESLVKQEGLEREVHHQVRNNLSVIMSLVNLQARREGDPSFRNAVMSFKGRILAISMVHELLHETEGTARLNVVEYIPKLVDSILSDEKERKVSLSLLVEPSLINDHFSAEVAIPLGLIINEVITNSIEHGFDAERPELFVAFRREGGEYLLTIADNGKGFDAAAELRAPVGLGLKLVEALCLQLDGSSRHDSRNGCLFEMRFPRVTAASRTGSHA